MAVKRGKILVVDDNAGIRRALEILLPLHFAEVKTLPSPAALVSTLEQFRPDVVLLDMNFNTSINTGNEGLYWTAEIKKMAENYQMEEDKLKEMMSDREKDSMRTDLKLQKALDLITEI